jgi:simple sugar transport system ATP-binding protein
MTPDAPLLRASGLVKSFGPVHALDGADFELYRGEIHALVGDNGAGKSTLIKVLSGVHTPDAGTVEIDGQRVRLTTPREAHDAGIETVYQDLALAGSLDAAENVFLGREVFRPGFAGRLRFVDRGEMHRRVGAELEVLGTHIPTLTNAVETMSGGQRQAVAVARAAIWGRRVLILDEPVAALAPQQTANVLALMDRVRRERDLAVIFISHTLPHVFEVADRVSVMRRGRRVLCHRIADATTHGIIGAMAGVDLSAGELPE